MGRLGTLVVSLVLTTLLSGCHEPITLQQGPFHEPVPSVHARGGSMLQDGLNLSAEPEPLRFAAGSEMVIHHRVVNEGAAVVRWASGGCDAAWTREVRGPDGAAVTWRAASPCDEETAPAELAPDEAVAGRFVWDGRDWSAEPPVAAAPGQYRVTVGFRYQYGADEAERLIVTEALVELRS